MKEIRTKAELDHLLQNRPPKTETWKLNPQLAEHITAPSNVGMRLLSQDEKEELAKYLGIGAGELSGPFHVSPMTCTNCSRQIQFLDFVMTAVSDANHSVELITAILTGKDGLWVEIAGQDANRIVNCTNCLTPLRYDYHSYGGGGYWYV